MNSSDDSDVVEDVVEEQIDKELSKRPRSTTLLNLKWLAERFRRVSQVKRALKHGAYDVDSEKLAEAILRDD